MPYRLVAGVEAPSWPVWGTLVASVEAQVDALVGIIAGIIGGSGERG